MTGTRMSHSYTSNNSNCSCSLCIATPTLSYFNGGFNQGRVRYGDTEPPPAQVPDFQAPDFVAQRGTYKVEKLGWDWKNDPDIEKGYYEPCEYADANLVGSKTDLEEDGHLPCIDLDLPAHLESSTKPGHYHLYINKVVPWDKYVNLLEALYDAGLINEGFKEMSVRRGQSYVRRPGVYKAPGEGDS